MRQAESERGRILSSEGQSIRTCAIYQSVVAQISCFAYVRSGSPTFGEGGYYLYSPGWFCATFGADPGDGRHKRCSDSPGCTRGGYCTVMAWDRARGHLQQCSVSSWCGLRRFSLVRGGAARSSLAYTLMTFAPLLWFHGLPRPILQERSWPWLPTRLYADEGRPNLSRKPRGTRRTRRCEVWTWKEQKPCSSRAKHITLATFTFRHIHDSWSGKSLQFIGLWSAIVLFRRPGFAVGIDTFRVFVSNNLRQFRFLPGAVKMELMFSLSLSWRPCMRRMSRPPSAQNVVAKSVFE